MLAARRRWEPCDKLTLEVLWRAGTHPAEIAELLNRTLLAVCRMAAELDITAMLRRDMAQRSRSLQSACHYVPTMIQWPDRQPIAKRNDIWSPYEMHAAQQLCYQGRSVEYIARCLGRSPCAVLHKLAEARRELRQRRTDIEAQPSTGT